MASLDTHTRLEFGRFLRDLRRRESLTLAALSAEVGVSVSALSQFETGKAEPSLGTLWNLGRALNASLFDFFAQRRTDRVDVTLAYERTVMRYDRARYEAIARSSNRKLDLFYLYLDPGEGPVREPVAHAGEESGVVVNGVMDVLLGDTTHRLNTGDGIWFDSGLPHSFRAVGDEQCVSIWADTLPDHAPDRGDVESVFGDGRGREQPSPAHGGERQARRKSMR